jgi:UDP-apiose/xylose synthase
MGSDVHLRRKGPGPVHIVILGAGGFIGSHLVERLLAEGGYRITGIDRDEEKLDGIGGPDFTFHRMDVRKAGNLVDEAVQDADVVVDLIAYANPSIYVSSPLEVVDVNFLANLDVVNRCVQHGTRLIQYSSAEVYGKFVGEKTKVSEDVSDLTYGPIHKHRWIYACAKQFLERIIHAHGLAGHLEFTIIRPFNFIGPRLDYLVPAGSMGGPRVVPHFVSALLTGGPMFLVDGGEVHRTFLHVDDATDAFLALLRNREGARNQVFNVGNPHNNITIRNLAELMMDLYEELTGMPPATELMKVTGEEFYGLGYDDSDRLPPDITKMQSLGWEPSRDLRTTMRDVLSHYLSQQEPPPTHG